MTPQIPPSLTDQEKAHNALVDRVRRLREVLGEIASDDDEGATVRNQRAQDQRWAVQAIEEDGEDPQRIDPRPLPTPEGMEEWRDKVCSRHALDWHGNPLRRNIEDSPAYKMAREIWDAAAKFFEAKLEEMRGRLDHRVGQGVILHAAEKELTALRKQMSEETGELEKVREALKTAKNESEYVLKNEGLTNGSEYGMAKVGKDAKEALTLITSLLSRRAKAGGV